MYKLLGWMLACTLAGVAGALFILYKGYIGPTTMSAFAGAGVLMMVLLGGMGTLWGPLVGAAIFIYIQDYISTMSEHWEIYLGIVVVFLVLFMPTGFVGLGGYLKRLRRG
jgi:branched-chain amino acid transport system permease protein